MANRLFALTFDCADAAGLGNVWAEALGRELHPEGNEFDVIAEAA